MALEKNIIVDQIEVVAIGIVQVRMATRIVEDGVELSRTFQRYAITPGQDYANQPERVRAVCEAVHTPEVVAAYQALIVAQGVGNA
jgi:hypothetical protein